MAIKPADLLAQVRNTAPFLFEGELPPADGPRRYLRVLRDYDGRALTASEYYELCLCAHWATAGTFVPTDVDNAIRWRLWQEVSTNLVAAQVELVLGAERWDFTPVTARRVAVPGGWLSTHEGTWFSVAVGAYAAAKAAKRPELAGRVLEAMLREAERERAAFAALAESGDALSTLKACALIAHNFGDLDRVADQWELPAVDDLRAALYDAAKPGATLFGGLLGWAGTLNQRFLSADNHRHYPLRAPRGLRKTADLLIPVGPFFDDWGRAVARHPALTREEVAEVVRALLDGWVRLHQPVGYGRALAGILEVFPGGRQALGKLLPGADRRMLESGPLKAVLDVDQRRFEAQWTKRLAQVPRPAAAV